MTDPDWSGTNRHPTWWARRSLRAKLTLAATLIIAVGMTLAAALLVWRLHASLIASMDTTLTQQAHNVAAEAERGRLPRQLPESEDGAPRVEVIAADGHVIAASADLQSQSRWFTFRGGQDEPRLATLNHRGSSYRVAALRASTHTGPVTVYAARPMDPISDSTTELISTLSVGVPILVAVLALVGWLLLGQALRPVEAVRRHADAIPGTDLRRRLAVPASRDELSRLAMTLNRLLDRIEAATSRQRQFVADAAHELRSPVATLRAQLEIAERASDPAATTSMVPGLLDDTRRLANLADDLLVLARMDATVTPTHDVVDWDDIVLDEIRRAQAGRSTIIDASGVSAGQVLGNQSELMRVVRNLMDNASRYATTRVQVSLHTVGAQVILNVADDGPGIPAADQERVFERFTRLDQARSSDAGGAGLGLAIVHDVVLRHDGTVTVGDNRPGARFTVTLPAAPS
jgi:signal transduction histidine kinase